MLIAKKLMNHVVGMLFVLSATPTWGISNIESEKPGLPSAGFNSVVELGAAGKSGNSKKEAFNAGIKVTYRQDKNIFLVMGDRQYGSTGEVKDTDESFIHARWMHFFRPKWAAETFTQWQEDEFDNLSSRSLLGAGARYLAANQQDVFSLTFGLGLFREQEKLDLVSIEEVNWYTRINSYVAYKHQLNDNVLLTTTAYAQPSVDDFDNLRLLSNTTLSVKLTQALNLKLTYKLSHDSHPAENLDIAPPIQNEKTNSDYGTTLEYRF